MNAVDTREFRRKLAEVALTFVQLFSSGFTVTVLFFKVVLNRSGEPFSSSSNIRTLDFWYGLWYPDYIQSTNGSQAVHPSFEI